MLDQAKASRAAWLAEARATLRLASPLVLTNVAQALIHATDVVLLGWVGATTLAAGTLGVNLYNAFLIFGVGLVTASAPMIARELGARSTSVRDVRRTVRQTIWAAAALSIPVWIILWNSEALLRLLGQDPFLSAEAAEFVRAMQWGFLPYLCFVILRSFVSALEQANWALVIGAAGVLFNGIVNYGLIFGKFGLPALGLQGAGIGSALTNGLMFLGLAIVVTRQPRFRRYRLFGRFWRSDWERFRAVWRLGLPIAVTLALEVTVFNAAVFLMGLIGTSELAAHAVALQIAALTFMVPMGIAQAATVRVGLAQGRGDRLAVGRAGWVAFALGTGFMTLTAIMMITIPHQLVELFLDPSVPENRPVIARAVSFLAIAALFQIVDGAQAVGAGMLRGLHDTTIPMIFAAVGYWIVGIGVGIWLGFYAGLGGVGIWIGLATGLAVVSVLMIWRWLLRERFYLLR